MSRARYIVADVFDALATLPDASVDLVFTSPPFLALRSYLPPDHALKDKEIGSESSPGAFIDMLVDVTEELARVLAPHGSLCFELGDTYSGSGGAGGDYNEGGMREGAPKFTGSAMSYRKSAQRNRSLHGWPLDKSLCLIPELYRFALAYGINPLTGRETPAWRIRNVVRWHRPNPPVGALSDKFRPSTSDIVVACKTRDRYFDLDAVRVPSDYDRPNLRGNGSRGPGEEVPGQRRNGSDHTVHPAGAPPLDTWTIPTAPYAGSHYATFPPALVIRPVLAMCPERVCTVCLEPSRRIAETTNSTGKASVHNRDMAGRKDRPLVSTHHPRHAERETTGWTDCGHNAWRAGVVLDPFAGSGTTLAVATGHGRNAIGIDLDDRNAHLALERVGMFVTIEHLEPVDA